MNGFWKIPKEWVSDWKLSATECIVLADLWTWDCSITERAHRCGISYRHCLRIINGLKKYLDDKDKMSQYIGQNVPPDKDKMSHQIGQDVTSNRTKCPIHTLYIEDIEEERRKACARTHTHDGNCENCDLLKKVKEQTEVENPKTEQPKVDNPIITTGSNLKKVEEVAAEFFAEVGGETQTAERFERLYHLPRSKIAEAVPIFRDTLLADGIEYKSYGDFRSHFNAWLKNNANRIFKELKTNGQRNYDNARDNDAYLASLMDDLRSAFAGGDVQ